MSEIFEIVMLVTFGASWPLNVLKSYIPKGGTLQDGAVNYLRHIGVTDETMQSIRDILIEEIPS